MSEIIKDRRNLYVPIIWPPWLIKNYDFMLKTSDQRVMLL